MRLETDLETIDDVDEAGLRRALATLGSDRNTRAILSVADEIYIQTATFDNGFVIEKREGDEASHFHAVPPHGPLAPWREKPKRSWWERVLNPSDFLVSECAFEKDEMIAAFARYLHGREGDLGLEWSQGYCDR